MSISGKMVEVCCAIIMKGSKILAVQRGVESSHPWKWEFPGGKIQPSETAEDCIIREIDEELQLKIEISEVLKSVPFDYGTKQIKLIPFVCQITSGEITLTEHLCKRWFSISEWEKFDWLEADRKLILENQESLRLLMDK